MKLFSSIHSQFVEFAAPAFFSVQPQVKNPPGLALGGPYAQMSVQNFFQFCSVLILFGRLSSSSLLSLVLPSVIVTVFLICCCS
jgi:hypothetical protein